MSAGRKTKGFAGTPWVSPRPIDRLETTLAEVLG